MYSYNLIIKADTIDGMDALVNRELTRRFGPGVFYHFHAKLTNEAVVIVSHESKRTLQSVLGEWFGEANRTLVGERREAEGVGGYPFGTLLHYREILRDEPIHILNKVG